jgi:tetratricopeptide (TPR) repeat protein
LEERPDFAKVKQPMGIAVSPILAPDLDAVGLLRSDDPDVETPSGLGANVFKDRGGLDRADFIGPDAVLVQPLDNDAAVSDDTLQKAYNLFEAVIKDYGLSKTGKLALPEAGYVAFQLKQYDNSIRCYKEFVDRATSDMKKSGLSSLSLLSVSSCYEAKGEFGKAVDTLKPLVELLGTPFRDLAMLDLERVYRLNKQPLQAKRVLEQFVLDYKSSPFFPEAKSRLLEYD